MIKRQNFFIGAAVAAGLVGTLTSLLAPRRANQGWASQTRTAAGKIFENRERSNKNWMLGSIAGGLVGMTTALLFAPKSGKNLIKDLAEPFQKKKEEVGKAAKKVSKKIKLKDEDLDHSVNEHHSTVHHPHAPVHSDEIKTKVKKTSTPARKARTKGTKEIGE